MQNSSRSLFVCIGDIWVFVCLHWGHLVTKSCNLNFTMCPPKVKNVRFEVLLAVWWRLSSSGMWHCVVKYVVPIVLKGYGAVTFRVRQVKVLFQNFRNYLSNSTVLYPWRLESLLVLLWEAQVSHDLLFSSGFMHCSVMLPAVCLLMWERLVTGDCQQVQIHLKIWISIVLFSKAVTVVPSSWGSSSPR